VYENLPELTKGQKMRVRDIKFWERRILTEISQPTEKQPTKPYRLPRNQTEELNYQIAAYFVHQQQKKACQNLKNLAQCKMVA